MKCSKCGAKLPEGIRFCTKCGTKLTNGSRFCRFCGSAMQDGSTICPSCGRDTYSFTPQLGKELQEQQKPMSPAPFQINMPHIRKEPEPMPEHQDAAQEIQSVPLESPVPPIPPEPELVKKSAGKKVLLLLLLAVIVIVIAVLVVKFMVLDKRDDDSDSHTLAELTQDNEDDADDSIDTNDQADDEDSSDDDNVQKATTTKPDEIDSSKVDLVANGSIDLTGTVKIATNGAFFLDWGTPQSILLTQPDSSNIVLENVSAAYLVNTGVDSSLWGILPYDRPLRMSGTLWLDNTNLYFNVTNIVDSNGNAIIVERTTTAPDSTPTQKTDIQILPHSATRTLTQADVDGLSLREINYAKNEIYARHGRLFNSTELQNYFNAQSWYVGSIAPEDFKESILSDVEKRNANFLANIEFSQNPKGYQLDAN